MFVCIELVNSWKKLQGIGYKILAPERHQSFPLELNRPAVLSLSIVQPLPLVPSKLYGAVNVANFLHLDFHD